MGTEVLEKNRLMFLQLFLHCADVSNPLKPFNICRPWAWRVLDEFFAQGDEEKELGLPVGMLNDREKVNRPGSQHGFINFMVAPLITTTVRLFPALHGLTTQMASNLVHWRDLWVQDAKPSAEEIARRDDDVQKVRDTAEELRDRCVGLKNKIVNHRSTVRRSSVRSVGARKSTMRIKAFPSSGA